MIRGGRRYLLTANEQGQRSIQLRANYMGGGGFGGMGNSAAIAPENLSGDLGVGRTATHGNLKDKDRLDRFEASIMHGFVDYEVTASVRALQNDMYAFDPVINSVIDIKSFFPFSNIELSGTESKERRNKYTEAFNAMQLRSMMPKVSKEKAVEGKHISYMNFNDANKQFTSIVPFNPEICKVTPVPVFGRDPLIDVEWPAYLQKLMESEDEDIRNEIDNYAEDIATMIKEKTTRLEPKFTLYLARTPFTHSPYGISVLRKLIPLWLYEKALMRGTIELSSRRQRPILHLMMGDMDWLPNNEQLTEAVKLFTEADRNPVGAFVATRPGIEINEVMAGENHWRWDSNTDVFTTIKLKALGVSDSIFGDFSVQVAEQAMSSFLEEAIVERDDITHFMLYNKVFLIIAHENGYKKKTTQELTGSLNQKERKQLNRLRRYKESFNLLTANSQHVLLSADEQLNPADYDLPQARYEKNLKIQSNDALFNNLGTLAERGAPASLRMQSAALGVPFSDILDGLEQDIKDRQVLEDYRSKLPAAPAAEGGGGGGGDNMFMESSMSRLSPKARRQLQKGWKQLVGSDPYAKTTIRNRDFRSTVVHRDPDTKKELSRKGFEARTVKENKRIMEAANRIREFEAAKPDLHERDRSYSYRGNK